jgi:hypothetical protein
MKTILTVLTWLLLVSPVFANPFLVSDPSPTVAVDSCEIDGLPLPCSLDANRAIHIDLQPLAVGSYTVKARFCTEGGLWCSNDSSPFSFVRPEAPLRPTNIKLVK